MSKTKKILLKLADVVFAFGFLFVGNFVLVLHWHVPITPAIIFFDILFGIYFLIEMFFLEKVIGKTKTDEEYAHRAGIYDRVTGAILMIVGTYIVLQYPVLYKAIWQEVLSSF